MVQVKLQKDAEKMKNRVYQMLDVPIHERSMKKLTINNKVHLAETVAPKEYNKIMDHLEIKGLKN